MKIAVLPGDGIGPEIMQEAVKVLNGLDEPFEFEEAPFGGAGYEASGNPLPDATLALAQQADAVMVGATGVWKFDKLERALRPEQGIPSLYDELVDSSPLKPEKVGHGRQRARVRRLPRLDATPELDRRQATAQAHYQDGRPVTCASCWSSAPARRSAIGKAVMMLCVCGRARCSSARQSNASSS